jgi:hypothetical protein
MTTSKLRTIALMFILVVLLLPATTTKVQAVGNPDSEAMGCIAAAGTFYLICVEGASSFSLLGPGMVAWCGRKYSDDLDACSAAYPY